MILLGFMKCWISKDLAANLSAIKDVRLLYLHLILEVAYANLERSSLKEDRLCQYVLNIYII